MSTVKPDTEGSTALAGSDRRVIVIDGRSGSGKTELATALAADTGAQVLRLDSVYPGWGGLAAGSALVPVILAANRWQRWDWATSRYAEWHELDPVLPLIVEGCGALSRATRVLATYGIWVELDDATRKTRALARDGEAYAPHWDEWAAQELAFIARENPAGLADEIVGGGGGNDAARTVPATTAQAPPATTTQAPPAPPLPVPITSADLARWRALLVHSA